MRTLCDSKYQDLGSAFELPVRCRPVEVSFLVDASSTNGHHEGGIPL